MRKFSDFIKEEIDLRGNRGIPGDFMRNSEEEAGRNLGVRIDDESQMRNIWPQFQQLMNQSMQLMMQGPDGRQLGREQMQTRLDALQNLAKDVIMDEDQLRIFDFAIKKISNKNTDNNVENAPKKPLAEKIKKTIENSKIRKIRKIRKIGIIEGGRANALVGSFYILLAFFFFL